MAIAETKERIDNITEGLNDLVEEATEIRDRAPEEQSDASDMIAEIEQQRQDEIDHVHAKYDAERRPLEIRREQARQAEQQAKRVSALGRFLKGDIGIFGLLAELAF